MNIGHIIISYITYYSAEISSGSGKTGRRMDSRVNLPSPLGAVTADDTDVFYFRWLIWF